MAQTGDAEAQSDEAQALVRSILNGLKEPTIVVDTDGRITNINSRALELYGTDESEALGQVPNNLQGDGTDGGARFEITDIEFVGE